MYTSHVEIAASVHIRADNSRIFNPSFLCIYAPYTHGATQVIQQKHSPTPFPPPRPADISRYHEAHQTGRAGQASGILCVSLRRCRHPFWRHSAFPSPILSDEYGIRYTTISEILVLMNHTWICYTREADTDDLYLIASRLTAWTRCPSAPVD